MKNKWKRALSLLLVSAILVGIPGQVVLANSVVDQAAETANNILSNNNTRRHAYVACLYDEATMSYVTTVLNGSNEMERSRVTQLYGISGEMSTLIGSKIVDHGGGIDSGDGSKIVMTQEGITATPVKTVEEAEGDKTNGLAPLSFPFAIRNATDADINRAYAVADGMGKDLMDALLFINNGHSYMDVNNREYLMQMRYFLLQSMTDKNGSGEVVNTYGYKYKIEYDKPQSGKVTITQLGYYAKLIGGVVTDENTHYSYRKKDAWDLNSFTPLEKRKVKEKVFTYKVKKGYNNGPDTFEDGTTNKLVGSYKADVEYINWSHLLLEADLLYQQGIAYSNYGDLYAKSVAENVITQLLGNLLSDIQAALGLYSIDDLVFNQGVYGTDAYVYGVFPAEWMPNIQVFYVIMSVLALSVIIISLLMAIGRVGLANDGRVGTRYGLVQGFKEILGAVLGVAFFIPICIIIFYLSDLITQIFAGIGGLSTRGISDLFPYNNYGTIAGIILSFAKLVICAYINVLYIIRRIAIVGLICFAPIFIVAYAFGVKGKSMTSAWVSELIGNLLMQPIHAGVFALLLSVCVGLRTIEALTMIACIIPLTNMYRGLITRGGSLTQQLAGKVTGGAVAATVGTAAAATGAVAGAAATVANAAGGPMAGGAISAASSAMQGIGMSIAGAGTSLALGSETSEGSQMLNSGTRQVGSAFNGMQRAAANNYQNNNQNNNQGSSSDSPQSTSGDSRFSGGRRGTTFRYDQKGKYHVFDEGSQYTDSDGNLNSEHTSSLGQFEKAGISKDGSMIEGKVSIGENSTQEQKDNFAALRSAYEEAIQTGNNDIGLDTKRQFGIESFRVSKENPNVAEVSIKNTIGAAKASLGENGDVRFVMGKGSQH